MERRTSPRFELNSRALLQLLGEGPAPPGPAMQVRIVDGSARGLRLLVPQALARDAAVSVDTGTALILAEVCYCVPDQADPVLPYAAGLIAEECLTGLSGIQDLLAALESNAVPIAETAERR